MAKKAVVLLSGGIDSTTTLAIARAEGYETYALSFDYGQRHRVELERAQEIARVFQVAKHLIIRIDMHEIGGSALTDPTVAVPKDRAAEEIGAGIPVTYVPARNTIFLAFALAWAEVLGAEDIFFGANVLDYSGYPDCRPEYLRAFEEMARLATRAGVEGRARFRIQAPLLRLTKAEIIRRGHELGVDYGLTWSCYDPVEREGGVLACGRCDSCHIRRRGFAEAGIADPLRYVS
ncbi:MAG: 7-cyano-7-deazaguanine synthase QueC [Blastocatellia bacterium]|nr:7-cyano-7-deazaguanine synthase QueC [Blastocatellia bacterium]MCS7157073.1 7-cyano-7-deazaguanine synthase QueC [Blastocatellia bacterium]MCX7752274.1 7-cyano-7-deazaguanine synthase QueC [Blastocatellia bacterium]MDW8167766.1 7-cyano-7-deazaguanine synthase QueC [Acidobacteriota bacterium]MDW8256587.1 7-cyano-7-deazaguanine synthase QueC [Acidobacteriota bacterium]